MIYFNYVIICNCTLYIYFNHFDCLVWYITVLGTLYFLCGDGAGGV